jgi:hypothetical protein
VVVQVVDEYRRLLTQGQVPPTCSADIINLCVSLSGSIARHSSQLAHIRRDNTKQQLQTSAGAAAEWLLGQASLLVQKSQANVANINFCLPMPDLCALAYSLHEMMEVLPSGITTLQLAQHVAQHATSQIQLGVMPPSVQAWCDLLYGLTKAGLVVNMQDNSSPVAVNQVSPHLQQLMDEGVQRLPGLLVTQGAVAQVVSLTLLSYAYAGYTGDLGPVTQALASNMEGCLQGVKPQECSNVLWALGKLCDMGRHEQQQPSTQPGAYSQELFSYALGQLHSKLDTAKPQGVSNAVYGCALAGHVEGVPQLLDLVCQHPKVMARAEPQHWSNTIWAAAKLGCVEQGSVLLKTLARQPQVMTQGKPQEWCNTMWAAATLHQTAVNISTSAEIINVLQQHGHQLLQACASSPTALQGAKPQEWSNTLWAAAVLRWYDQHLYCQGVAALAAMPPAEVKPQAISNALYACALCAHWDGNVQQLLGRVNEYDLAAFESQALANTLYAWAMLCCIVPTSDSAQRHMEVLNSAAAALFKEAASQPVSSFTKEEFSQLDTAHLYAQHLGIPGLPAGPVLEEARAAGWSFAEPTPSDRQREVASTLRQLGYTVQVEMKSPDGVMSVDVGVTALPDGSPCSIAVEFDGPFHYVTEHTGSGSVRDRLNGPTRLRNTFLHARFPDGLVCIPWKEWVAVTKDDQQEEYIMRAMAKVLESKVRTAPCLFGSYVLHVMTVQRCKKLFCYTSHACALS